MDPSLADDRWTRYGLFREAADAVRRALDADQLGDPAIDVDPQELSVLLQLARTPDERLRMTDLARAMAVPPPTATRIVDRCVARGLVERLPCPDDRRVSHAVLTDAGRTLVTEAAPALLDSLQRYVFDVLTDDEAEALAAMSRRLRDHAHDAVCDDVDRATS